MADFKDTGSAGSLRSVTRATGHGGKKRSYNILIATDFTIPARGGIETHGY